MLCQICVLHYLIKIGEYCVFANFGMSKLTRIDPRKKREKFMTFVTNTCKIFKINYTIFKNILIVIKHFLSKLRMIFHTEFNT